METLVVQIFGAPRRFAAAARPAFRFCRSGLTSPLLVVRPHRPLLAQQRGSWEQK